MKQPLEGVRVLDLSRMLTGGYATMLLGDLGAEVIKIEPPAGGDPLRAMPPHFDRGESAYFLAISRNKKSVTLDLRIPQSEGRLLSQLHDQGEILESQYDAEDVRLRVRLERTWAERWQLDRFTPN